MLFLNFFKLLLLLGGPFFGYQFGIRRDDSRRWSVIAWSAAGGGAAAVVLIGLLFFSELSSFASAADLLRAALPVVARYALFGLIAGFALVLIPYQWSLRRIIDVPMFVVIALILVAIDAAAYAWLEKGAKGLVFGPGNVPAKGVPVFLDTGLGPLLRLTTDTTGQFRAPLVPNGYQHTSLLICVPGGMPTIERLFENAVTVYHVTSLPARARVQSRLRQQGWLGPIPRECVADTITG